MLPSRLKAGSQPPAQPLTVWSVEVCTSKTLSSPLQGGCAPPGRRIRRDEGVDLVAGLARNLGATEDEIHETIRVAFLIPRLPALAAASAAQYGEGECAAVWSCSRVLAQDSASP